MKTSKKNQKNKMNRMSKRNLEKGKAISHIIKKMKSGDEASFHKLYAATWKEIYYMLFKNLRNEEDAKLLLNDVFMEVRSSIQSLNDEQAFYPWINKMAYYLCADFIREKQKNRIELREDFFDSELYDSKNYQGFDGEEFLPEKVLDDKETRSQIIAIIDELPDVQRSAIFMFYYNDFTVKEIAEITNTSENTVYKRLYDGRRTLKSKLKPIIRTGTAVSVGVGFEILREIIKEDIVVYASENIGASVWSGLATAIPAASTSAAVGGAAIPFMAKLAVGAVAVVVTGAVALNYKPVTETNMGDNMVLEETSPLSEIPMEQEIITEIPTEEDIVTETPIKVHEEPISESSETTPQPLVIETKDLLPEVILNEEDAIVDSANEAADEEVIENNILDFLPDMSGDSQNNYDIETETYPIAEKIEKYVQEIKPDTEENKSEDSSYIIKKLNHKFQINESVDDIVAELLMLAGEELNRDDKTIVLSNDFDINKIGNYEIHFTTEKLNGEIVEVQAFLAVSDNINPNIYIENPIITLQKGEEFTLETILQMAELAITDNSSEDIKFQVEGYDEIDFSIPRGYILAVNAEDSSGNKASQEIIIIKIKE